MQTAGEDILVDMLLIRPRVEYRRDKMLLCSPRSRYGHTHASSTDADGFAMHVRFTDFLILSEDLPPGFTPKVGDIISAGGNSYLVSALDGEPCWLHHTRQSSRIIRVHTRLASDTLILEPKP